MGGSTDRELLFCETFNHEGSQVRPFTHAPTEPQSFAPEQRFYLVRTTTHSSHSPQGLHVDLMRFPLPVVVKEVRIVSPDITVCPELPMKIGSILWTIILRQQKSKISCFLQTNVSSIFLAGRVLQ